MMKWLAKPRKARFMGGTSQVKAMCLGGNWEVQARYMRGTCDIKATSRRRKKDECRMQKGEGAKQGAVKTGRALARMRRKETGRAQGSPVSEAGPSRFGDGLVRSDANTVT
jgi:hypothetical protein